MTERVENLILEHLRAIRAQLDRIESDVEDLKNRDHTHEAYLAAMHSDSARQSARLDQHDARLRRIERRLELAEESD
jgi:type II secretory pathway component PulM